MKYTALGGGNEVGASCNLLQLNGTNFLLDAGIRMGAGEAGGPADALPDLALLQEAGGVEAVLVSHAHLDHIGALPLVHQAYPAALIYATVPTVHLMRVLLADALKIMSIKAEQEFECPLYNEELVARMFTRVVPVPVGGSVQLPGAVRAFFFSAGHILGAAMIGLEGAEGRVLYTGDISAGNQRTISGMVAPDFAPHLLIMESTYGNRLHANRQREEKALVETVAEVIESGGHALIPAFALGRAQEIILLIQAHQQAGLIPRFPIWVDGMVRSICQTYINFPELLRGPLKRFINNGGNPFFREKGARPVTSTPLREKVLAGAPACIVSSSGMLTGGPSQFYASRLVDDPRHAIIFCGYQDEESPGHRLLALADNPEATIALDGRETRVQCRLAQYGLSAHADAGELAALAARMRPRRVVLVHGDDDARRALARTLADNRRAVLAPENGEWLEFSFRRAGRGKFAFSPAGGAGGGAPGKKRLHPPDPGELWQELIRNPAAGNKLYSAEELAALWFRGETTPERQAQMAAMLEKDDRYFAADWKHPYFYRPRRPDQVAADRRRETIMQGLSHLPGRLVLVRDGGGAVRAGICYAVDRLGFYAWKVGQDGTWHPADSLLEIIASWYEPAGTAGETQDEEALKSEQKQQLHRFLLRVKPVYRQLKPLKLWEQMRALRAEPATAREWRDMLGLDEGVESLTALAWRLNTHPEYFAREFVPGGVPTYVCREEISRGEAGPDEEMVDRMEQNAALAAAEELFPAGSGLYRKGLDRDAGEITLYFHFPATAVERYRDQIEQLSAVTGWSVRIHPEAHHGALSEAVHRLLPGTWRVLRNPSIHRENSMVSVRCEIPPGEEHMVAEVAGRFKEQTGQELCIERPGETGAGPLQEQPGGSVAGPAEDCMEINAAYAAIRAALQKAGATVYKTGKKRAGSSEYIEVSFISPDVGERYREVLDELQKQTGWPVRINPRPNQNEIKALVRRSLEPAWGLVKEPGFFEIERVVRVKLKAPPAPDDPRWLGLVEEIKVKTGYQVEYIES